MPTTELPQIDRRTIGIVFFLFNTFARFYFRLKLEGQENIPSEPPYIIVLNHNSTLDIPLFAAVPIKGDITFIVKREAFENRLVGGFIGRYGAFPVDRDAMDAHAARIMLASLKAGRVLGLAPEGTRSVTGEILEFKPGFVKLALIARVPIVPVGIIGTHGLLPTRFHFPRPGRVTMRIGKPIDLSEYFGKKLDEEQISRLSEQVRQRVIALYNGAPVSD